MFSSQPILLLVPQSFTVLKCLYLASGIILYKLIFSLEPYWAISSVSFCCWTSGVFSSYRSDFLLLVVLHFFSISGFWMAQRSLHSLGTLFEDCWRNLSELVVLHPHRPRSECAKVFLYSLSSSFSSFWPASSFFNAVLHCWSGSTQFKVGKEKMNASSLYRCCILLHYFTHIFSCPSTHTNTPSYKQGRTHLNLP